MRGRIVTFVGSRLDDGAADAAHQKLAFDQATRKIDRLQTGTQRRKGCAGRAVFSASKQFYRAIVP